MINILILCLWTLTPLLIYNKSRILPYLLFGSLSLSIFDNPFNINIYYLFYFGFIYFVLNIFKIIDSINLYLLYFIFYNTVITIIFYFVYYYETDASFYLIFYTYLVSQFKIISLFGIYYYLVANRFSFYEFNYYFLPPLFFSIVSGYIIYLGFDSPYHYFKNFGYTTNESTSLSIIRLSGLTQEPRYLSYLIVFSLLTIQFSNFRLLGSFFSNIFLGFSLLLTKSLSGFMLLFLSISYRLLLNFNLYKLLLTFFLFLIIVFYLMFSGSNFLYLLNQRIFDRNLINFNYLPNFFSYFEHHDLVALKFLEENWLISLFGFGYGQIKNYEAVYGDFVDPSMTLFNYNTSIHCCDPQSLLINFISSFGIINLIIFSFLYFRSIGTNNIFFAFVIFNLFNLSPGPLPFFIMIFSLCINFSNFNSSHHPKFKF